MLKFLLFRQQIKLNEIKHLLCFYEHADVDIPYRIQVH